MNQWFNWDFNYPSQRMPVLAKNIVSTSQPLASQAGLRMLSKGGNAIDASIAAAITLTVVEPMMNGIGSDAFALLWDGKKIVGLNASGRSPGAWTTTHFSGRKEMPLLGWDSVTIPGAVSAWVDLSKKYGQLSFKELFSIKQQKEDALFRNFWILMNKTSQISGVTFLISIMLFFEMVRHQNLEIYSIFLLKQRP